METVRKGEKKQPVKMNPIRAWVTIGHAASLSDAMGKIVDWWDDPSIEGESHSTTLEWEADGHHFTLSIEAAVRAPGGDDHSRRAE